MCASNVADHDPADQASTVRPSHRSRLASIVGTLPVWLIPALLGLAIGLYEIGSRSIWMDEAATLTLADRSLRDLLRVFAQEEVLQAPYYVAMNLWTTVAGTSEVALRLPSALGVGAAAGITALVGSKLYSRAVGMTAGLVFALLPAITSLYAQEARVYGLVLFIACASALGLIRATDRPTRLAWIVYGSLVVALGLGHVLALAVLPAHGLFVGLRSGRRSLVTWTGVAANASKPGAFLAILSRSQGTVFTWIEAPTLTSALDTVSQTAGSTWLFWLLLGVGIPVLKRTAPDALVTAWLVLPPVVLFIVSYALTPTFVARYFLLVAPALALFAARGLVRSRVGLGVGIALIVTFSLVGSAALRDLPSQAQDYRAAAAYIAANQVSGDAYVVDHPAHRDGLSYYWRNEEHPEDVLLRTPADERGRLYAGEVYPATPDSLTGVARVWVVEDRRLYRREEFEEILADFSLADQVNLYGLEVSRYDRRSAAQAGGPG